MKEYPLISVITTVYNTEKYVERCFDSVMKQTYPNIEFIIVDNASKGNIDEIVSTYQSMYADVDGRTIRLIRCTENQGIFKARVKGGEEATGEYIAFIDSDDRVSIDFYRLLEKRAEDTGADLVAGNVVHEILQKDGTWQAVNYSICPIETYQYEYTREQICDVFFSQYGRENYWNLVWNKLYRRNLWLKCLPLLRKQTETLVMYDDVAFTTVFYLSCEKITCCHNAVYYYCRRSDANSVGSNNPQKFQSIFRDMRVLFDYMEAVLSEPENVKYYESLDKWKDYYYRTWCGEIEASSIPSYKQKKLQKELMKQFQKSRIEQPNSEDAFFYSLIAPHNSQYEEIKKKIADPEVQVISFDVFDTLVVRPFWFPNDMFYLLNEKFNIEESKANYVDFSNIRIKAETFARDALRVSGSSYQDITLDDIYEAIGTHYFIPKDLLDEMKRYEIELELKYCEVRNSGKELYQLARHLGKKVIAVSDMYLPTEVITAILKKNGYDELERVFVSSETKRIKITTEMFRYVVSEIKVKAPGNILHIGDNLYSDYFGALKAGLKSAILPRTIDVFQNLNNDIYAGESFQTIFQQDLLSTFAGNDYFWIRCMLAVVANHIFDNPFKSFCVGSDFDGDPYYIGYYTMGMYMYSLGSWLKEHVEQEKYDKVHFIARDGLLLKKCFETMCQENIGVETNYLYISRKALFPLLIANPVDLNSIKNFINIYSQSPKTILEMCKPIIEEETYERREKILKNSNCIYSARFTDEKQFEAFLHIFKENFYKQEQIDRYRLEMKEYFGKMIKKYDCTFDVGYSGRSEFILSKLLDITLNAYYIHVFWDRAEQNSKKKDFKITPFEGYSSPSVARTVILEKLICETGPSCIGYRHSEISKSLEPEFAKKSDVDVITGYIITVMQNAALEFVRDFTKRFGDQKLTFDYSIAAKPFNYFLNYAKEVDQKLFAYTGIEDDLGLTNNRTLMDCWEDSHFVNMKYIPPKCPKWKKGIVLALFDRKTLKEKVKRYWAGHPFLLMVSRKIYHLFRSIYHLIWRKHK